MGLFDAFKAKKYKQEIGALNEKINSLNIEIENYKQYIKNFETKYPPEVVKLEEINAKIIESDIIIANKQEQIAIMIENMSAVEHETELKRAESLDLDDRLMLQEFGLYKPTYEFVHSEAYKEKLDDIREQQKTLIKNNKATVGNKDWTVNGSKREGNKMVKDTEKLLLRAFNSECDALIEKVKYNTFETYKKRIEKSIEAISKLGKVMEIKISDRYASSKLEELTLAFEYQQKKQEEKEEQRRIREQEREQAKLMKEIEEARKSVTKDKTHYEKAKDKIMAQLSRSEILPTEKQLLNEKLNEYNQKIEELNTELEQIDYREANQKAGYVYVISNIGSFGKDIYKIGMTRRLDPMERVYELGDASVPFNFDVHAMIFSNDAPALEAKLHKAFDDKKVNMINQRREFFNVKLEDVKKVIYDSIDKTVEFVDDADAEQYYQTLALKNTVEKTVS